MLWTSLIVMIICKKHVELQANRMECSHITVLRDLAGLKSLYTFNLDM